MNRRDVLKGSVGAAVAAAMRPALGLILPGGAAAVASGNQHGLGVHLGGIAYYNGQLPFLNVFLPGQWITAINGGSFDTGEEAWLPVDSSGWPTAVSVSGKTFNMARKLINYNIQTASYTGTLYPAHSASVDGSSYTIQGEGAGNVVLAQDVDHNSLASSSAGITIGGTNGTTITSTAAVGETWSVTFGVTTPRVGIDYQLQATDPLSVGNYIKNIVVYETRYAANVAAGEYFNPIWLAAISQFQCIRCMDWLSTNNQTPPINLSAAVGNGATSASLASAWALASGSYRFWFDTGDTRVCTCAVGQTNIIWSGGLSKAGSKTTAYYSNCAATVGWPNRIPTTNATYTTVPWEVCLALSKAANTDLYLNIPAGMQLADIQSLANYLAANMNPGWRVYIEDSNELWNSSFNSTIFYQWLGEQLWPDYATRGYTPTDVIYNYSGYRLSQIVGAFQSAFGSKYGTSAVIVCGGQAANTFVATQKLTSPLAVAEGTISQAPYLSGLMHVCIAPYFGNYNVPPAWLAESQSTALTSLFAEINTGGQIAGDGGVSYLSTAYGQITAHANVLAASPYAGRGMLLLGYESGQTFISAQNDTNVLATPAAWAAVQAVGLNHVIDGGDGHCYQVTTAGTTGSTAPTWNMTVGATTTDGSVTWTRVNNRAAARQNSMTALVGDPINVNGQIQLCTTAGTAASSAPAFANTNQATTTDGTAVWTCEIGPSSPQDEYTALFAALNHDSRMGTVYTAYYEEWKSLGGALCNTFVDISQYTKHGEWGAAEDLEQLLGSLSSMPYRWQSVVNFSQNTGRWWA